MMDESIVWKEAKGPRSGPHYETQDDEFDAANEEFYDEIERSDNEVDVNSFESSNRENSFTQLEYKQGRLKTFSHQQINLSLRRNIVALGDKSQHKPKPTYASDSQSEAFDSWLEDALVAISPTADLVLFAGHRPEKIAFVAKLRKDPINQYITKSLEIPLDYDEQATSLLCLPIMSSQKTAFGLVDWTALVIGLSSGYVRFYTEQSICLLSLKFCDEPITSIKCQTQKVNTNGRSELHFATIADEMLITYRTLAVIIDGLGLYECLRISMDEVVRSGSSYEPAYNLTNLPSILNCQKWKINEDSRNSIVLDADLLGTRRTTTFDSLLSDSINFENIPPKACAPSLALVGSNPFLASYRESQDTGSHSYTELIGSLFSLWNKPLPSRVQISEISKPSIISLFDKERLATSIVSSPDRRLAAVTDNFGRVLLVDATNWLVIRIWKGYRSAQCGWVEVRRNPEKRSCPHALFLVIYAPKRGLLEIWSVQRGPRVAAFNVGKSCRLLYSGFKMFNMRAEGNTVDQLIEQGYTTHCYLLNANSETIFSIDLPYTYSLYKYGDLKSRDHLLIGELVNAIQQDSEVESISEILHRIALAESLQTCIHKISLSLGPSKIVPIMENLINKTMKNYDNHSGETMNYDDMSIIDLCKRIIRLCSLFKDLSEPIGHGLSLPDVNQRLIEHYEEHPQEIEEFSRQLGWSTSEILRYLSLLALERSYRENHLSNPWPNLGEPLAWSEFINCFNLNRCKPRKGSRVKQGPMDFGRVSIRLKEFNNKFLSEDKVVKTALFLYNHLSETYYKSSQLTNQSKVVNNQLENSHNYLEPSTRLALLFEFWLATKLCNHWKMWAFLQSQVGRISDELKVIAMDNKDDKILIETWKQIYNLILESDNVFAAITATAAIRSDTLRMIQDNERREKLDSADSGEPEEEKGRRSSFDWECLCIDAERMSLLSQQLEDVFLLNLLLKYSVTDGHLIENYLYRMPRISVANILRGGPTVVTELVAQWAVQSGVKMKIFTQPYGQEDEVDNIMITGPSTISSRQSPQKLILSRSDNCNHEENAKELLHHVKTSYPHSLEPDVLLINCVWEFCRRWSSTGLMINKTHLLKRAYGCLSLVNSLELRHKIASVAYKTFIQRTFERLVILVETNSTLMSAKSSRIRDALTRKELNIGEDCLEEFVQFCCDLSEFMLESCSRTGKSHPQSEDKHEERLLTYDNWWTGPYTERVSEEQSGQMYSNELASENRDSNSLIRTILFSSRLLDVNTLIEMNRLANLMNLIFKLRIIKAYPMSLIGEEAREVLQLDLQQSPVSGATSGEMKSRNLSLNDLREKFARKCILNIVSKMTEEASEFNDDCDDDDEEQFNNEAIDTAVPPLAYSKSKSGQQQPKGPERSIGSVAAAAVRQSTRDNAIGKSIDGGTTTTNSGLLDHVSGVFMRDENNESMVLFANLLSLANEWKLNCDELYLELVFELYRCNQDKIGSQMSTRVLDQQTLANGLLKISSQRVLVLFALSPHVSGSEWRRRSDKWSLFQPNVASWLKSIQQEEMRRELASLSFSDSLRSKDSSGNKSTFGLQTFVLQALRSRTKLVLESVTNHLEGQAGRLAYDLLELLESQALDKELLEAESRLSNSEEEDNNHQSVKK